LPITGSTTVSGTVNVGNSITVGNTVGVNVLNTPLPITGSVTTTGSVSLTPGSSVSVINTAQNPVPVREIREPFQARTPNTSPISSGLTFPAVPAGKRLVIEHLSVSVNSNALDAVPDCALTSSDQSLFFDFFGVQQVASKVINNAANNFFVASVQTKFYVETGQTPKIVCSFLSPPGPLGGSFAGFISGYFTPLP